MKKVYCLSAILVMMVFFACSAAAAPRIDGISAGSVTDSTVDSSAALWNPASIVFSERTLSFSIAGSAHFFAFQKAINNILKEQPTAEDLSLLIGEMPSAGYLLSYSDQWFGCSLSLYGESLMYNNDVALTLTLSGAYQFTDVPILGDVALGCNLHLFRGASMQKSYYELPDLLETDVICGNGVALDLGVITKPTERLHFALVLRDVVYGFWGTRTYRTLDAYGNLLAEASEEYVYNRDSYQDNMLFGDPFKLESKKLPQRTTLDLGVAILFTETTRMTLDIQNISPFLDAHWNLAGFRSISLGFEQAVDPLAFALNLSVGETYQAVGLGASYHTDHLGIQLQLKYHSEASFQFQAGLAWQFQ